MEEFILMVFILILVFLNIGCYLLFKRRKLDLVLSGFIMMIIAPVIGFSSGALFIHFYDWSSGGTGEGAGFGGAFLGLITLANGILIVLIGVIRWMIAFFRRGD